LDGLQRDAGRKYPSFDNIGGVMKRTWKLMLVTAFAAAGLLSIFFNRTEAVAAGKPVSPRSLYVQNCARCHGADGKAQTTLGRKLEADDISGGLNTAKTTRVVTNGRGSMPSFKRKLPAAKIRQIAGYVRTL